MTLSAARLRRAVRRETVGVDVRGALNLVGSLVRYLSIAYLLPIAFALGYREPVWPFVVSAVIVAGFGLGLEQLTRGRERVGVREGFLVVALTWLLAAAVGALPYLLSGEGQLSHPIDAYFEAMSGFTTTGASVLTDVPALSHSLAMWRQFTQWLGGMGIIVLALAVLPRLRVGGRQLFESEAPGPEADKLAASIRETARRLWLLYVALTALMVAALTFVGWTGIDDTMGPYEALAHAFSTLPTGGFSTRAHSFAEFGAASQWITIVFMALAGMNFALLFAAIVQRRGGKLLRDHELRLYFSFLVLGALVLLVELVSEDIARGETAFRQATFEAVSTMTTTGAADADYVQWSALAAVTLVGLMFIGGSAGSTAGSIKVVRHLLIGKILRRELDQTVHPEIVVPIRLNGSTVDERTLRAVIVFVLLYVGLFAAGALVLTVDAAATNNQVSPFDAIAAAATTLGNVGPGFGFAGPYRLVRRLQRPVQAGDDRADVARPARDPARDRALHQGVLARLSPTVRAVGPVSCLSADGLGDGHLADDPARAVRPAVPPDRGGGAERGPAHPLGDRRPAARARGHVARRPGFARPVRGQTPAMSAQGASRVDAGSLAVDRDDQRDDQDRDDVGDLDHRVDRRAGGVLVGVADRVARDRGGVGLGALAAVLAVLDELLRVVPGAAARGHRDREEETGHDRADQQAAEHLRADDARR